MNNSIFFSVPGRPGAGHAARALSRRTALAGALIFSFAAGANASLRLPYTETGFEGARQAGRSILVHVTAPWCAECKLQKPIVARLAHLEEFKDLVIFDVDFDTEKDALRHLNVHKQSTLVVFKGGREIDRLVGVTNADTIEALLKKAV